MSGHTLGDLMRRAIELTPMEFSIEVDPHKPNHETVADYLGRVDVDDLEEDTWRAMLAADTVILARAYLNSVAQLVVYGADLVAVLRELVEALELKVRP